MALTPFLAGKMDLQLDGTALSHEADDGVPSATESGGEAPDELDEMSRGGIEAMMAKELAAIDDLLKES
jgi:hypothetical protein